MQKRACLTASLLIGIWPHTKPRSLFAALSFTPAPAIESRKTQKQRKTWTGFRVLRPFHPSAIQSRKARKQQKTWTGFRALRPFRPSAIQSTGDGGPARGFVGQRSYLLPGEPPLAPARPRRYN